MIILLLKIIFLITEYAYLKYSLNISPYNLNTKDDISITEKKAKTCEHNYEFSKLIKPPNFNEEGLQLFIIYSLDHLWAIDYIIF